MKSKKYRTTIIGGLIVMGLYSFYHAYMSFIEGNIWIFLIGFVIGAPIGIYLDILLKKEINKSIVGSEVVFKKDELYKNQIYGLVVSMTFFIGLFIWLIFLLLKSKNIIETLKTIIFYGALFNGFVSGMLCTGILLQYIWVLSLEKRSKTRLIEKNE